VESGCPGISSPACLVEQPLSSSASLYDTGNILVAGSVYYYKVFAMNTTISNCIAASNTKTSLLSCEASLSSNPILVGSSATLTTSVNASAGIADVRYTLGSANYASFNPSAAQSTATDVSFPYSTTVYGRSPGGPTLVTSDVREVGGAVLCSDTDNITVTYPQAWWQVKDSDIQAQGDLSSSVPASQFFGLNGAGGYPGVAAYSSTTNLTNTNVSENNSAKWFANSSWASPKIFNYAYFNNQIPEGTTINTIDHIDSTVLGSGTLDSATGYYWYKYNGDDHSGQALAVTTPTELGTRKVIVLVENANVDISQSITLTDGFFMLVVEGNINISPDVGGGASPNLEGLYIADGVLQTGTLTPGGNDTQLWLRGSVVAYSGISLSRDLKDSNGVTPGELFEYAPDQIMLFPDVFATRKINWKEVAP
jgi:hypothetical protein